MPSFNASNFDLGTDFSDKWLKDASYVRLRNFSFGYNFDKKTLEKSFITALKLFVQGENLYTWTKWRGFDPEDNNNIAAFEFPAPRTYTFGLDVTF